MAESLFTSFLPFFDPTFIPFYNFLQHFVNKYVIMSKYYFLLYSQSAFKPVSLIRSVYLMYNKFRFPNLYSSFKRSNMSFIILGKGTPNAFIFVKTCVPSVEM